MTASSEGPSYERYVEEAPIGIFELDRDGECVDANEAGRELVGCDADELLGTSFATFVSSAEESTDPSFLGEVGETGRVRTETTIRRPDGTEVEVLLEAVAVEDDRVVAYVQDISESKGYERRLRDQRDDLQILNQVLRHDVRNDLQLITAYAGLLADRCEQEEAQEHIDTIRESADHAVELTETARELADLMLSARDETHEVDLQSVVEGQVSEVRSSYPDAVITYETPVPAVRVTANEMLSSVFRNLLKNAIQHNDKEVAEVTVSAAEHEETVTVRVADNGPGVPDGQKETIFGKNERGLDSSGVGMGLYLVDSLVTRYGGEVWVEDNDPEGAVFVVELPKASQEN